MSAKEEAFGEDFKELCLAKQVSQGKHATLIGKTTMYVSNIKKRKNNSPDKTLLRVISIELKLEDGEYFQHIHRDAAERGTVAQDFVKVIVENSWLRKFVRDVIAGDVQSLVPWQSVICV